MNPGQTSQPPQVQIRQGRNFTYELPAGWVVAEEGNFALYLHAPNNEAGIVVSGISGLLQWMSPEQFASFYLCNPRMGWRDMRFRNPRRVPPMPGCAEAADMDVEYILPGGQRAPLHMLGMVISNVAWGYNQCNGTVTLAASLDGLWGEYCKWLPQVAMQAINTGPDPYGSHTVARGNWYNSLREGAAMAAYRDWSRQTWDAVAQARAESQERQSADLGPMLAGQQWYNDPYGNNPTRQSASPAVIWVRRDGRQVSSYDPAFDPRTPTDPDWRRMEPQNP